MDVSRGDAVVAGVDGTVASDRAAMWAARQAAVLDLPLLLVHGMPWPAYAHVPVDAAAADVGGTEEPMRRWARDMLGGLAERCRDATGVDVRTEIVAGDPADAIVLAADRAAFVVVGHSDDGGVPRSLLGSTAERLTRSCPWPVVVVRGEAPADERRANGLVVVGVDGSAVSGRAIRFAFGFAARHVGEVLVVHAVGDPVVDPVGTGTEAALRDGRGPAGAELVECERRYPGVRSRLVVAAGPPEDLLLTASDVASLLVVGSHGKGALRRAFLGSVSHEVVNNARCPVAVLPSGTVAADPG